MWLFGGWVEGTIITKLLMFCINNIFAVTGRVEMDIWRYDIKLNKWFYISGSLPNGMTLLIITIIH